MIDMINEQRHEHIMTVEDPIEFLHRHKNCVVNQRELGADAHSFSLALKSALRQDPDVILVGEMRDLETMSTAITAAETGHLVFATLHTQDTSQTVDRIVDAFPPAQQHQVRTQLSIALQGIVTQQLLPTVDGQGRVCACEVLIPTPAVRNLIREGKTHQLYSALQTGGSHGMQTMDAALADLVRGGTITRQLAESRSSTPEELKRLLEGRADSAGPATPSAMPEMNAARVTIGGPPSGAPTTNPNGLPRRGI
jgi:twitching motility protein PilT